MNRRARLRGLVAALATTTAALALAGPSLADGEGGNDDFWGPAPQDVQSPAFQAQIAAEVAQAAAERIELLTPEAQAERQTSRLTYGDLDSNESADLAAAAFPETIEQPTWTQPTAPEGSEIVAFQGLTSAVIAEDGAELPIATNEGEEVSTHDLDTGGLLESTSPIRAPEEGHLQPIDPTLVSDGDDLEPANATVEPSMPTDLPDGIDLHGLNVTVTPAGADDAVERQVVGSDKLFYADVAEDTDFIAASTSTGIEAFWQLRSPESPSSTSLSLDLPDGGMLEGDDAGGATIADERGPIATVLPPAAFDADGTPVPVDMDVSGSGLELSFPHADGDYHYPILVDPVIEDYDWANGDACPAQNSATPGISYWHWETGTTGTAGPKFAAGCNTGGILNQGMASKAFSAGDFSQWIWRAPAKTFIGTANFWQTRHVPQGTCASFGIFMPSGQTGVNGTWQKQNSNRCASWSALGQFFNLYDPSGQASGSSTTPPAQDQNVGVMQLLEPNAITTGASAISQQASTHAAFTLYDRYNPTLTSSRPADFTSWVNDNGQQYTHTLNADDQGLGVKSMWMTKNGTVTSASPPRTCSGTRGATSCTAPTNWSYPFTYTLPEGKTSVGFAAFDQIGNAANYFYTALIDRSAPTIGFSGELTTDAKLAVLSDRTYQMTATATDQTGTADSQLRSGVKKLEMWVASSATPNTPIGDVLTDTPGCSGIGGACPAQEPATLTVDPSNEAHPLADGTYVVVAKATDQAGNVSATQQSEFAVRTDEEPPDATVNDTALAQTGQISVSAADGDAATTTGAAPPSFGSGVSSVEVLVDGTDPASGAVLVGGQPTPVGEPQIQVDDTNCLNGGCALPSTSLTLTSAASPAAHEITIVTTDRSGVQDAVTLGTLEPEVLNAVNGIHYSKFGYNDAFTQGNLLTEETGSNATKSLFERAIAGHGNATTIRFPISWCQVEKADDAYAWEPTVDPDDATRLREIFRLVHAENAKPDGKKVYVLPTIFNVPAWVRTPKVCGPPQAQGGSWTSSTYPEWQDFLRDFVGRFGMDSNYGLIGVEVWNEPNFKDYWPKESQDASLYADFYASAIEAVKGSQNPDLLVVPAGLSPAPPKQLTDPVGPNPSYAPTYAATFLDRFDQLNNTDATLRAHVPAVAVHLYSDPLIKASQDAQAIQEIKKQGNAIIDAWTDELYPLGKGANQIPVWVTEIGFPAHSYRVRPATDTTPAERLGQDSSAGRPNNQARRLCLAWRSSGLKAKPSMFLVHRLFDPTDKLDYHVADDHKELAADYGTFGLRSNASTSRRVAYDVMNDVAHGSSLGCKALVKLPR